MHALFDIGHGQHNWSHTGFLPRTLDGSFSGFASILNEHGFSCVGDDISSSSLKNCNLLVIPPPVGQLNPQTGQWESLETSLFTEHQIDAVLQFVHAGGSLIAFSYRFGDAFSKTNLGALFSPLGCSLNEIAVSKVDCFPCDSHLLTKPFETGPECVPLLATEREVVKWRAMTTLNLRPDASCDVLAFTPPRSVGFNRETHRLFYNSQPLCVGGQYGAGNFTIFGGPHVFETGVYGLLNSIGNQRFARAIIRRLLGNNFKRSDQNLINPLLGPISSNEFSEMWSLLSVDQSAKEKGELLVSLADKIFKETGAFHPLGRSVWNHARTAEFDLVYRVISPDPIWAESKGIVCVECKNWEQPVGANEIGRFAEKVDQHGSRIGFFLARSFTKHAWLALEQVRLRRNTLIGLLSEDDYRSLSNGFVSPKDLIESSLLRTLLL